MMLKVEDHYQSLKEELLANNFNKKELSDIEELAKKMLIQIIKKHLNQKIQSLKTYSIITFLLHLLLKKKEKENLKIKRLQ